MYMTETKGVKWILEYLECVPLIWLKRSDDLDRVSFLFACSLSGLSARGDVSLALIRLLNH